ncbi:hypothetical protein LJR267_010612 [Paraburkholderia hospita]|uniref:hypothetical protein n=1 Tax=Paraburkholderia hospita TaxID=169430 RepID=UPI003ECF4AAE
MQAFRLLLSIVVFAVFAASSVIRAAEAPVNWIQGKWIGTCSRNSHSLNAGLLLGSSGGLLNEKPISGLLVKNETVSFTEGDKQFVGRFLNDFNRIEGKLSKGSTSPAECTLVRRVVKSNFLCVFNPSRDKDLYVRYDDAASEPTTTTTIKLLPREKSKRFAAVEGKGGRFCFDDKDFPTTVCPQSVKQETYYCQD